MLGRLGLRLARVDPDERERGGEEADCIDEHGVRRRQQPDQQAPDSRPGDLRRVPAHLERRVPRHELVAADERREVGLVRDVEGHGQRARDERGDVQLAERERVREVRDRNRREHGGPSEVGHDQDRSAAQAVDPDARRQREQEEGEEVDGAERCHLERARVEDEDRRQRDRELRYLRAELADRLAGPELEEVAVTPQPALRPGQL